MLLGGVAAIGAIFGNPFVTAFMILEFAAFGIVPAVIIPAVLVALAAGYLTQIGIYGLTGFGLHSLSVSGLTPYDTIEVGDLALTLVVALLAAGVAAGVRVTATVVDRASARRPVPVLYARRGGHGRRAARGRGRVRGRHHAHPVQRAERHVGAVHARHQRPSCSSFSWQGDCVRRRARRRLPRRPDLPGDVPRDRRRRPGVARRPRLCGDGHGRDRHRGVRRHDAKLPATSALLGVLLVGGGGAAVAPLAILGAVIGLVVRMALDARMGTPTAPATSG